MPRHYTNEEKQLVLQRLSANHGDVARTVAESGVPIRTLYNWQKNAEIAENRVLNLKTLQPSPQYAADRATGEINPEVLDSLYPVRDKMLLIINSLIDSIIPAIKDAPLNQRVAALTQITDRYIKLGHELPSEDEEIVMEHDVQELPEEEEEDGEEDSPADTASESGINS